MKIVVTGAGGFIGGHLVKSLLADGHTVTAVDIKPIVEWYQKFDCERIQLDLENQDLCNNLFSIVKGVDEVFNLACNMGGIGFITNNKSNCMFSVLINANMLRACIKQNVKKYFFSSTACVYNTTKQITTEPIALKEEDAYPALPEVGYGWEKLFSEQLCETVNVENLIETRIARFHNVYGPLGSWNDGREKAPAAICRKVALAKINNTNEIEIWGDGSQMRSFMYIDDCIIGIKKIMEGNCSSPINLGSAECVSINQLVAMTSSIAGVQLRNKYNLREAIGVMGRNSDNTKIKNLFDWEPSIPLATGLKFTYDWIYQQCQNQY